jgi:hypothetical protein
MARGGEAIVQAGTYHVGTILDLRRLYAPCCLALQSPVDIPPALDSQDLHRSRSIVNIIEYPELTHPDPPSSRAELEAPLGPGSMSQYSQALAYPHPGIAYEPVQVFLRSRTEQQPIHAFPAWTGRRQG